MLNERYMSRTALNHMVALYCSHLRCLFILHDLHQKDAVMIGKLRQSLVDEMGNVVTLSSGGNMDDLGNSSQLWRLAL